MRFTGIMVLLFGLLFGCTPQATYSDDVPECSELQGEARMVCLRPDLLELYGEVQALRVQTQALPNGENMRRFANMRSEEVYQYCYARFQTEANCVAEWMESLRDQLSVQLELGEALSV